MTIHHTDDVRGVIIGGENTEQWYTFYTKHREFAFTSWLSAGWFESDAQAETCVKEHYPAEYAIGIEMRVRT